MEIEFMVQRASGGEPTVTHHSFDRALKEAERLSRKTGGEVFYVVQVLGAVKVRIHKVGSKEPLDTIVTDQIGWGVS